MSFGDGIQFELNVLTEKTSSASDILFDSY